MKLKHFLALALVAICGSAWAQTDVTSTYLVNPSFELKAEGTASTAAALSKTGGTYYGWNLPNLGSDYANVSIGTSSACDGNGYGIPTSASDGSFYFFNRKGWGTQAGEISQTTTLPAGKYFITVDYKAYERTTTNGTLGFKINETSILSTKPYYAATSNSGSWAKDDPWKTIGAWFTVETEGNVKIAISENLVGGSARADLYLDNVRLYKWDLDDDANVIAATESSPLDVTAKYITNPYIDSNKDGWTSTTGYQNNTTAINHAGAISGRYFENWNGSAKTSGKMSYTATNLPSGKYRVTMAVFGSNTTAETSGLHVYAADQKVAVTSATAQFYRIEAVTTTGSLEFGVVLSAGNPATHIGIDNVRLEYMKPTISVKATEIPVADVIADKWYKFTVATAGEYKITSSVAANIKYTQDGNLFDEDVTTSLTFAADETKIENLTAGTIYVNADAASTILIAPNTYSYEVGSATADIAYVQAGNVVTISYADAVTNDEDATFAINGTPSITFGGNAIDVTPTANGFTFTVPEVTAATDYTLSIPADAFGYAAGSTYNEAQNIVLKTPAILDQIAYIYSPKTEKFVSRGDASGTSAIIDVYGIPVDIKTDGNNNTTFKFVDNQLYLFNDNWAYTDGAARNYTVSAATTANYSGYTFVSNGMPFYINGIRCANNGIKDDNYTDDDLTIWQIKTKAERNAIKAAKELADIVAVAAAAGETVTSLSELEAILDTKVAADQTSKVKSASLKSGINGWTATNVRKNGNEYTTDQNVVEFYQSAEKISQTISNLDEGIYKVTLNGLARFGTSENCVAYGDYDLSNAYLKANDYQVNLKSWASERTSDTTPDSKSTAAEALSNGSYLNTLYTYVGDYLKLTLTIDNPNYMTAGWVIFNNLTLTYYGGTAAVEADYTALASAISAAEENTLGFAEGEYAPYTNIDAITALNAAKAIDPEKVNLQSDVQNAAQELNNATWNANTEEMNAIYDGGFSLTTKQEGGYLVPTGWTNLGYNTRVYNDTNKGTNAGVDAGSENGCLFAKFTTAYGTEDGYTMPLKEGNYYLQFIYGGWNEVGTREIKVYKKSDNNVKATVTPNSVTAKSNQAHNDVNEWSTFNGVITIPSDGEYVLEFYRQNTSAQNQIAISDIELKTASTYTRATANEKYGTLCLPYAFDATGADIYTITSVENSVIELSEKAAVGEAGVPYIYQATAGEQSFTQKSAPVAEPKDDTYLVGSFKSSTDDGGLMSVPQGAYILQTLEGRQGFYKVTSDNIKCGLYKCYLTVPAQGDAREAFFFDGDETAINALNALTSGKADIYDLNGRKLNRLQKGINIVNGVKIIVK